MRILSLVTIVATAVCVATAASAVSIERGVGSWNRESDPITGLRFSPRVPNRPGLDIALQMLDTGETVTDFDLAVPLRIGTSRVLLTPSLGLTSVGGIGWSLGGVNAGVTLAVPLLRMLDARGAAFVRHASGSDGTVDVRSVTIGLGWSIH